MKAFAWQRGVADKDCPVRVLLVLRSMLELDPRAFPEFIAGPFLFFGNAAIHVGRFLTPLAVTLPRSLRLRLRGFDEELL